MTSANPDLFDLAYVTGPRHGLHPNPVQALDLFIPESRGPFPLILWIHGGGFSRTFFPGGAYDAAFARRASPASYLHAGMPPLLVVHGARDTVVPLARVEESVKRPCRRRGRDPSRRDRPRSQHHE